jgi:hypothetical protein
LASGFVGEGRDGSRRGGSRRRRKERGGCRRWLDGERKSGRLLTDRRWRRLRIVVLVIHDGLLDDSLHVGGVWWRWEGRKERRRKKEKEKSKSGSKR